LRFRKSFGLILFLVALLAIWMVSFSFWDFTSNVSAVEKPAYIGVYWDDTCSSSVYSIDWGVVSLGEIREVGVYVRNEGDETLFLALKTANWDPENAYRYLRFSWSWDEDAIHVGQVVRIVQSLHVSPSARGITTFSFDIIFVPWSPDIDGDGDVDMRDLAKVAKCYGSKEGDPNYESICDLDGDGEIDMSDVTRVVRMFGRTGL